MEIKLTTLCENTVAGPGFSGEWGLSILIQIDDQNILFDTGAESAVVRNADKIGFDSRTIDTIILSHAHGDTQKLLHIQHCGCQSLKKTVRTKR